MLLKGFKIFLKKIKFFITLKGIFRKFFNFLIKCGKNPFQNFYSLMHLSTKTIHHPKSPSLNSISIIFHAFVNKKVSSKKKTPWLVLH